MQTIEHTMMWRRFDLPGLDAAYFGPTATGWRLCGTAIFAAAAGPCHLGYAVDVDDRWRARSGHVFGTLGGSLIDVHVAASSDGTWTVNGEGQPDANGCVDLDLGFTTSARVFTLRRLALLDGQEAVAPVAQLNLPDMDLVGVTESYLRLHDRAFRFATSAGGPSTVLSVDGSLTVLRYPGRWDSDSFPAVAAPAPPARAASRPDYQTTLPANAEACKPDGSAAPAARVGS